MKINIGCGTTKTDGYYTCDHTDIYNADYVFDLEKDVFPFEDNSIEEVVAHHILEHLGDGYFHCMKELYRVCKNGAIIDIVVPHFRNQNQWHNPTHKRCITYYGLLLLDTEQTFAVTSNLAKQYGVDFKIVYHHEKLNIGYPLYDKIKEMTKEELESFSVDKNDVYEETHIKLQVKKL